MFSFLRQRTPEISLEELDQIRPRRRPLA